jgi:hypothetical protein
LNKKLIQLASCMSPKQYPAQNEVCMTSPTLPDAIFSTLQGT